jgi:hypothetical protein
MQDAQRHVPDLPLDVFIEMIKFFTALILNVDESDL